MTFVSMLELATSKNVEIKQQIKELKDIARNLKEFKENQRKIKKFKEISRNSKKNSRNLKTFEKIAEI